MRLLLLLLLGDDLRHAWFVFVLYRKRDGGYAPTLCRGVYVWCCLVLCVPLLLLQMPTSSFLDLPPFGPRHIHIAVWWVSNMAS
jgi:hypothetical protein